MTINSKSILAIASFSAGIVFALLGLFLPPMGVIDSSVNMLVAQQLVLAATLLGVDSYYTKMKEMDAAKARGKPPKGSDPL